MFGIMNRTRCQGLFGEVASLSCAEPLRPKSGVILGAREHNLKNIDLEIPRDQLVVITRLSRSGSEGAAAVRGVALGLRPVVPGADGKAGRLENFEFCYH
jgi:hypothetical protein